MPMFYFIPFQLKSDLEKKMKPPMLQLGSFGEIVLYLTVALMLAALFVVFIVLPMIMVMHSPVPAG